MFERFKYNLKRREAAKAARRKVSPEQAIKDFGRFRFYYGYEEKAKEAGKTLHVRDSDGSTYKVIRRDVHGNNVPQLGIIESISGDDKGKRYEVAYLPSTEFYK